MLPENYQHRRVMEMKYKRKLQKLQEHVKQLIFENAALCDDIEQTQSDLERAREERRFLIERLIIHEGSSNYKSLELSQSMQVDKCKKPKKPLSPTPKEPKKRGPKKRSVENNETSIVQVPAKVNKLVTVVKPLFPINLYSVLLHSLGDIICGNSNFHNAHWIYPVGYVATRVYAHPKDPHKKCIYTCKILNNAGTPQFQIIPDNNIDSLYFGETADICHQALLQTLQRSLSSVVKLPFTVQGEKFFGLSHPKIKNLLQAASGFSQCIKFKGFSTIENQFAIPEDKDPTLDFDSLQSLIATSVYHAMPAVRNEPPDELFDFK